MKKMMIAAMVSLVMSGAACAAGYGLEASRMEGGLKFAEKQIGSKLYSEASPVRISGEFAPVSTAKCNAEARDYNKLTVKAPPALKLDQDKLAGGEAKSPEKKGAITGGIVGGVLASPVVIAALPAIALLGTGMGFVAVGPLATAAIVAVGAVAAGAAIGYGIGCLVK